MAERAVAELAVDGTDDFNRRVISIYTRKPLEYAVYQTTDAVDVQYAQDPQLADEQRGIIARLNPLKGEVLTLAGGTEHRTILPSSRRRQVERRNRYAQRVADALVLALEDDPVGAEVLLNTLKDDLVDELTALGRLRYLTAALVIAAGLAGVVAGLLAEGVLRYPSLWKGAAAGALGAFASMAISLRSRSAQLTTPAPVVDLDAVLRIALGATAGALGQNILDFALQFVPTAGGAPMLVVGFVAGFSERLVPDLLLDPHSRSSNRSTPARRDAHGSSSPAEDGMPEITFENGRPTGFDEAESLAKALAVAQSPQVHAAVGILNAMLTSNTGVCALQMPPAAIEAITRGGTIVYRCEHSPTPHEF